MSIPTQRDTLIGEAESRFAELEALLDAMERTVTSADAEGRHHAPPPVEHVFVREAAPQEPRDRDATDVVNHLHAWHVLLMQWLDIDEAGGTPAFPAEGYTWGELDALNHMLRDHYRGDGSLPAARDRLRTSHRDALARVERLSDADLFATRHEWAHGTLVEPVHECLGGHYEWALEALEHQRLG